MWGLNTSWVLVPHLPGTITSRLGAGGGNGGCKQLICDVWRLLSTPSYEKRFQNQGSVRIAGCASAFVVLLLCESGLVPLDHNQFLTQAYKPPSPQRGNSSLCGQSERVVVGNGGVEVGGRGRGGGGGSD